MSTQNIVVTGGSGTVGRYLVKELMKFDYKVTIFDMKEPQEEYANFFKGTNYCKGNILKIDDCKRSFKGTNIVIHLGAIPHPIGNLPELVFNVNVLGTYNVFQAACDLGITKVIFASSDASYGFHFRNSFDDILLPEYLPIDEDHPQKPKDCYGLSKKISEEIATTFNRKYGITTIGLRISHVRIPEKSGMSGIEAYQKNIKEKGVMIPSLIYNESGDVFTGQIFSYNDVRDVAQAFRLTTQVKGLEGKSEIFCIGNIDDIPTKFETKELIKKWHFDKIPLKRKLKKREPLCDFSKANRILGYRSKYNWWEMYGSKI